MHGIDWDGKADLTGWWMSEKMDGVRGYWNGETLLSRNKKEISCPEWFKKDFPKGIKLDGELWMGRGLLQFLMRILNSATMDDKKWKEIKYVVFDLPDSNLPYESRMESLRHIIKTNVSSYINMVNLEKCDGNDHFHKHLREISRNGGEGLMLNQPQSLYYKGRASSLLKAKVLSG
jgi:DNA ligase-1